MYIRDLEEGQTFTGFFLVAEKQLQPFSRKPGNFLSLVLQDKTGTIQAKVWEDADYIAQTFQVGDVVDVTASVGSYRGELQLTVTDLRPAVKGSFRWEDLIPGTSRDVKQMKQTVQRLVQGVRDRYLRQLLSVFFGDSQVFEEFATAPAAKRMHQAYLGGLIEHTLNVWELARAALQLYPESVDEELLLSGVLLHDIGKIKEYSYQGVIELTDDGKLLGHILIGSQWVKEAIDRIPGFPAEKAVRLLHMIISHHGRLEYGSPKRPKTVEACILHHADMMDAQVARFTELARSAEPESGWSRYDRALERAVYAGEGPSDRETAAADEVE